MGPVPVGQALLEKVAANLGGEVQAAERLGLPLELMRRYLSGTTPVPDTVLLRAVDVVLDEFQQDSPGGKSQPFDRNQP